MKGTGKIKVRCACGHESELGRGRQEFKCPVCGKTALLPKPVEHDQESPGLSVPIRPVYPEITSREDAHCSVSGLVRRILKNVEACFDSGDPAAGKSLVETAHREVRPGSIDWYVLEYYVGMAAFRAENFGEASRYFKSALSGLPSWGILTNAAKESRRRAEEEEAEADKEP